MRNFLEDMPHRLAMWLTWSPLLMLGVSVMASVVLISACMAMMSPEAEASSNGLTAGRPAPVVVAAR
jgi:hypothetical protein